MNTNPTLRIFHILKSQKWLLCLSGIMVVALWGCADKEVDVTIEQAALQQKVAPKFPLEKKVLIVSVTLHSPKVYLSGDKVGLTLHTDAMILKYSLKGTVDIQGGLRYVPETGQFFVTDVAIVGIDVGDAAQVNGDKLKSVIAPLVADALKDTPVYTLPDTTLKDQLVGKFLKRVTVQDSKLIATFGKK